ncbi:hypothetical protein, partial [Paenibacillus dendritiformis]|uniref:hypothetical protein n=1 Tax=Paenibacillus dendritiformis TaxID=130049 RepID=UPI001EE64D21
TFAGLLFSKSGSSEDPAFLKLLGEAECKGGFNKCRGRGRKGRYPSKGGEDSQSFLICRLPAGPRTLNSGIFPCFPVTWGK